MLPLVSLPWKTGHSQTQPLLLKISKLYQSTTLLQTSPSLHAALTPSTARLALPDTPKQSQLNPKQPRG